MKKNRFPLLQFRLSFLFAITLVAAVATWLLLMRNAPQALEYPPIEVEDDGYPVAVDADELFADPDHSRYELKFSVAGNTNPDLVAASVDDLVRFINLKFTPGKAGKARVRIQATDPRGWSASNTLEIRVNGIPKPRTPTTVPVVVKAGTEQSELSVYDFFTDAEEPAAALEYKCTNLTNFDLLEDVRIDARSGLITLIYRKGASGTVRVGLTAWDSLGASGRTDFDVTVLPVDLGERGILDSIEQ